MKGERAAATPADAVLEGGQKILTQYEVSVGSRTMSCYPAGGKLGCTRTEGTGVASVASEVASLSFNLRTA